MMHVEYGDGAFNGDTEFQGVFPVEHTCDGANRSPAITILGVKTPYLAIVMRT